MSDDNKQRDQILTELEGLLMQVGRKYSTASVGALTPTQFMVLRWLANRGLVPMGDLAEALGITMAGATGLVDRLVHNGLVRRERSDQDRRLVLVGVTELGCESLEHVRRQRFEQFRQVTKNLPLADLEALVRILENMVSARLEGTSADESCH